MANINENCFNILYNILKEFNSISNRGIISQDEIGLGHN